MTVRTWRPRGWQGEAGVGRADITPPIGIRAKNWGAATSEVSTGTHRPLLLTALVLREGPSAEPLVLISMDGGVWRRAEDEWHVRGAVMDGHGLDPSRVMLHLTHTHAGPSNCREDAGAPGGEYIAEYLDQLREAAVRAVGEALAGWVPATVTVATGRSSVAACRDLRWQRRYVVGFNPDAEADDTLLVGRVASTDGRVLATLVNYACHPTTLAWQNTLVSPDLVDGLREVVEAGTAGAPCLFLQGASGDLAPREQYSGDTGLPDRHGHAIGHAALAALQTLPSPSYGLALTEIVESGAPLALWRSTPVTWPQAVRVDRADLPVRTKPVPSDEELEHRWSDLDPLVRQERLYRAQHQRARSAANPRPVLPVWIWKLGEIVLVGQTGEAYSTFQRQVRQALPGEEVFVLNLVNGPSPGYLPPEDLYRDDVYQVWQTTLGAGTLEQLTEHTITRAKELGS